MCIQGQSCNRCTFHDHLYASHKTMDDTQGLCNSHPSLFPGQSIQSLEDGLYLAFPKQLSCELPCGHIERQVMYVTLHVLNRPSLICFDARASTESSSTIILTTTSANIGVGGIVVSTSIRLRKF